jgi:hypothetical protein
MFFSHVDANKIKHAKKHAKSLFQLVWNGCEVFMKAKLPQSHLVLLSFAKFCQFRGLFRIFFALLRFVRIRSFGAPYLTLSQP